MNVELDLNAFNEYVTAEIHVNNNHLHVDIKQHFVCKSKCYSPSAKCLNKMQTIP